MIEQETREWLASLNVGDEVVVVCHRPFGKRLETIEKISKSRARITLSNGADYSGKTSKRINAREFGGSFIIPLTPILKAQLERRQRLKQSRSSLGEICDEIARVDDPVIIEAAVSALESILRAKVRL
jgi:hypothetical protein